MVKSIFWSSHQNEIWKSASNLHLEIHKNHDLLYQSWFSLWKSRKKQKTKTNKKTTLPPYKLKKKKRKLKKKKRKLDIGIIFESFIMAKTKYFF